MTDPQEVDPDLDTLTRDELHELGMPGAVSEVLDVWLFQTRAGVISSAHGVGAFLDLLADAGYRVERIDPGPPLADLLPPPKE